MVAAVVHKMIDDPEDRKDVAQDIYIKTYLRLEGFKYESKLSTWICQIGYNTCIDYLRKKKISPQENMDDTDMMEKTQKNILHAEAKRDIPIVQKDLAGILKAETNKLSPLYRTLITLFHHEELSYDEIGQVTGLPPGTVKSYLFRARKTLKNNLLSQYKKEDL